MKCSLEEIFERDDTQTCFPTSGSPTNLETLLKPMSAWDYHRLLRLHRTRTKDINDLIFKAKNGVFDQRKRKSKTYSLANCQCTTSSDSLGDIFDKMDQKLMEEIERSGPNTEKIVQTGFLFESARDIGLCAPCCIFIFAKNGRIWVDLKEKIDKLPDHV